MLQSAPVAKLISQFVSLDDINLVISSYSLHLEDLEHVSQV